MRSNKYRSLLLLLLITAAIIPTLAQINHQQVFLEHATGLSPAPSLDPVLTVKEPTDGEGVYESCAPANGQQCLNNVQQIASGGFKVVMNYDQLRGTMSQITTYMQQANTSGVKVLVGMSDPLLWQSSWTGTNLSTVTEYSQLYSNCKNQYTGPGSFDNYDFLVCAINLYKSFPATYGYYIGDEIDPPSTTNVNLITKYSNLITQTDTNTAHHKVLVAYGDEPLSTYLTPFANTADVLGVDYYPVGSASEPISDTGPIAANLQTLVNGYTNKFSTMALQAFNRAWYPLTTTDCSPFPSCATFPTEQQLRTMHTLALQNATPRLLLWYSFFDIQKHPSTAAQNWAKLVTAVGLAPSPTP